MSSQDSAAAAQNRDALLQQAMALRSRNHPAEALQVLAQLQALCPRYSHLYQERGHCYAALSDLPKAIEAFQQAVTLNAALPLSWQMLQRLYQESGDQISAGRMAQHLSALGNLPAQIIEGASLFADGDLIPAERILRKYLAVQGEHLEAMRLLGRICLARGLRDEAEALLQVVVLRAPGYHAARADYARALLDQHRYLRSREELQRLLELDPGNRAYRRLYAEGCLRQGEFESGLEGYRQLLTDAQPGQESAELQLWIAYCLRATGQSQQAIASYRAALAAWPDAAEAWWGLANLKTYRFAAEEITRMREAEAASSTAALNRLQLCFALGKALEDQKDYAGSWQYYQRGNALKHESLNYQPEMAETHTRQSTKVCTREFFHQRRGWGCPQQGPIFILGLTRSGSTLIEQILASHSQIEGTHELPDLQRIVAQLRGRNEDPRHPRYPGVLAQLGPQEFKRFGEQYLADTRGYRKSGKPFFIDKLPDNFRDIGLIQLILPNARIIDARREPMACSFGNFKQLYSGGQEFSYSLADMARYYRSYLELMQHWSQVLPNRVLTVQHEALVTDLEGNVRRLLNFCGLPFEPACLSFHHTERSVRTASSEQVRQPLSPEGLAQWLHYAAWLGPLKDALGDALTRYRH